MIIVNFKNYKFGKEALVLVELVEKYLGKNASVSLSSFDISLASEKFKKLGIYAQHIDAVIIGRNTGFLSIEGAKKAGAIGSLLNHSEHTLPLDYIKKNVELANKNNFKIILCASTLKQAKEFVKLKPFGIAYEDPELVGSGRSITNYNQKEIIDFVSMLKGKNIKNICGAGVSSAEDVKMAFKLGCDGVLISSAIANVSLKDAEKLLKEIGKIRD
ncbi:MAG: triose-phosphate isomerase [Nanoarchaeota archaeon]